MYPQQPNQPPPPYGPPAGPPGVHPYPAQPGYPPGAGYPPYAGPAPHPLVNSPYSPQGSVAGGYLAHVKPSPKVFWKSNGLRVALVIPAVGFVVLFGGRRMADLPISSRAVIAAIGVAIGAIIVLSQLFISRVSVSGTELVVRSALGLTKKYNRPELSMAVLAVSYRMVGNAAANSMLVLVTSRNKRAARMSGVLWSRDSIERVLAALALPRVDVITESLNAKQFSQRYPKLLPFQERRPIAMVLITTAAIFVAIIVGVSVFANV